MKKLFIGLFEVFILLLTGCNRSNSPVIIYQINTEMECNDGHGSTESLYIEKDNERFVWTRNAIDTRWGFFYFSFSDNSNDYFYYNSTQFRYKDSENNEINFTNHNDNYFYEFYGNKTIYIYYDDSSEEIKKIIDSNVYNIEIASVNWFSNNSLY